MTLTGTELFLLKFIIWTVGGTIFALLAAGIVAQSIKWFLFSVSYVALSFQATTAKRIRKHYESETAG